MHNGPLGLFCTMLLQFTTIYGKAFINYVNDAAINNPRFSGICQTSYGIFCKESRNNTKKNYQQYTMKKLNADQLMGFMRSTPAYIWQVLSKEHYELWILILHWFSILYDRI